MGITNIHEAKTHLSRLVDEAAAGKEIIIGKAGKPLAKLVPYVKTKTPRKPGSLKGKIWIDDKFNEPLPREIEAGFYGKSD